MNDGQIRLLIADLLAHRHCADCEMVIRRLGTDDYPIGGKHYCRDCFLRHEGPLKK